MAALQSSTPPYRHVRGDMVSRFFTLAGNNGDTLTFPGMGPVLFVDISPTTAISVAATIVGNVITFVTSGAWAALVEVTARYG